MRSIPLPELLFVFTVTMVYYGVRALWRSLPASAPRAGGLRRAPLDRTDPQHLRVRLIASCVMFVVISIPLIVGVVPPNGIYGFRNAATRSSRAIWYPANAFMGWALSIAAVTSAVLLMKLPATVKRWWLWAAFLVPAGCAVLASFAYLNRLT